MPYIWTVLYVGSILLANLTLNQFIQLPFFGLLSIGTLFFACVFTLRDKLHTYGLRTVFIAIGLALGVNLLVSISLDTPIRFIAASFIAILLSELTDTLIYQRMIQRSWLTRSLSSNSASIPFDSIVFSLLAFYGTMSLYDVAQIIWADILFKSLIAGSLTFLLNTYIYEKKPKGEPQEQDNKKQQRLSKKNGF